jgi:ElaB/YqjD/DUF883 family membrane-anchored ribosome-binding protein
MSSSLQESRTRLTDDLGAAVSEARNLLNQAESEVGDRAHQLRNELESSMHRAKTRLVNLEKQTVGEVHDMAHRTDHLIHERPWQAAGVALVAGVVLGLLMNRR